jgi:putative transposase
VDGLEKESDVRSRSIKTDRRKADKERMPCRMFARSPVGEGHEIAVTLADLAREGARRMIAAALEAEATSMSPRSSTRSMGWAGGWSCAMGTRAAVTVGSGTLRISAPRVNDKRADEETGERKKFSSRILRTYARRSPKVTDVRPILYLRALSTGDFGPALRDLLGGDAAGCRPARSSA